MHVLAEGRFKKQRGGDYVTYVEQIDEDGVMTTVFVAERQRSESGTVLSYDACSARVRLRLTLIRGAGIYNCRMVIATASALGGLN
jgi:hypothetical protein